MKLTGLVAATFTPMNQDGVPALEVVPRIVEHLIVNKVSGLYVCGSTGEGPSLSREERQAVAAAYIEAAAGRVPVMIQVGHSSLEEAKGLAAHAASIGADAVSALAPAYFKPASLDCLMRCLAPIAEAAGGLPFYYYHIPRMTAIDLDMAQLLQRAPETLPTLQGIKFSNPDFDMLRTCLELAGDRYDILFGVDEMLLAALQLGVKGAVGSTYNFAAPLYNAVIEALQSGDMDKARACQWLAADMVRVVWKYRGMAALKAMMPMIGLDCGPARLPIETLTPEESAAMKQELDALGFFEYAPAAR